MLREAIATGETVEDAQRAAAEMLGAEESANIEYEILSLPQKKTLGIFGGSPAKVRAFVEATPGLAAKKYLEIILEKMGIKAEIELTESENGSLLHIEGEDVIGAVIGRRGETLDALQYLCSLAANQVSGEYCRVTLNAGTYREKREKALQGLARRIANSASKTGRNTTLEPMNAFERRIIHTIVQDIDGVSSWSVGEGEGRRVVIGVSRDGAPARPENDRPRYDKDRGRDRRDSRGDSRGGRFDRDREPKRTPDPNRAPVKDKSDSPLYGRID